MSGILHQIRAKTIFLTYHYEEKSTIDRSISIAFLHSGDWGIDANLKRLNIGINYTF